MIDISPFHWNAAAATLYLNGQPVPLDEDCTKVLDALVRAGGRPAWLEPLDSASGALSDGAAVVWATVEKLNAILCSAPAGNCFISHHPGEGFRLVAPTGLRSAANATGTGAPLVVGRTSAMVRVASQLGMHRFVTIAGAGGMGKSTVAQTLAQTLAGDYRDGVHTVDLSSLAEERLVANAVGIALGVALSPVAPLDSLAAFVRGKNLLLILESCEHFLLQVAAVAEAVIAAAPAAHVLATSREPLLASGEQIHRLPPMELPAPDSTPTPAQALRYSAVELFVHRVKLRNPGFELAQKNVMEVVDICRRLDGLPLAIEIAAARSGQFGITGLAQELDAHILALEQANTHARHATLSNMLDWSYNHLPGPQQRVLRQLSMFRSGFTLECAEALVAGDADLSAKPHDSVLDLAESSLLSRVDAHLFRLLDTTRAYADSKLLEPERSGVARRHARLVLAELQRADAAWLHMPTGQWLGTFGRWIDDLRLALDWSLGPGGDTPLGISLAFAGFSLARQLSLDAEFRDYVERALQRLECALPRDFLTEITLKSYLGSMGQRNDHERSPQYLSLEEILAQEGSAISPRDQIIAIGSINHAALMAADFATATRWAEKAGQAARDSADAIAIMISCRMRAQAHHFMGHHEQARDLARQVLDETLRRIPLAYIPSPVEQRVSMRILLGRILWMQGFPDAAVRMADECLEHSLTDTAISQCQALALCALPIALWTGDHDRSQAYVSRLGTIAQRHSLGYWQYWGQRMVLTMSLQDLPASTPAPAELMKPGPAEANLRDHLCTFEGRLLGTDAIARTGSGLVGWCAPEVLRLQAQASLKALPGDVPGAERLLRQSIALANSQRALSWKLRASISLAELLSASGRSGEGRLQLQLTCAQFTEGQRSADLRRAHSVLAALCSTPEASAPS